jgi:uncharacterized protein YjbI with pentapeptide repeats
MADHGTDQSGGAADPFDAADLVDRLFCDLAQQDRQFQQKEFVGCTFERCRFVGSVFEQCRFDGAVFRDCDLSVIKLPNTSLVDVRFEGCKLIGVDWTAVSTRFLRMSFDRCLLSNSTFARMDLQGLVLVACTCHDCDFLGANLARATCHNTDFAKSRFVQANLSKADFTGATRYLIDPTMNTVKGAIFSLPEAVSLLRGLGVVIR